ncbi:MAG TPA: tetratricopeptide repeat protein, partial [Candidatus Glassbacteria bacterium]|nr:tetratricopeptide repeat protein [Candidatus Glassbacteria bacterium]
ATLSQPGGKGTACSAKVEYVFPKNDYSIPGETHSVESEKECETLANDCIVVLVTASEKISAMSIARSYFNSAIYDKAIENYQKLIQMEPDNLNYHYWVAMSYLKSNQNDQAIAEFNNILTNLDPNHIPSHETLANYNFTAGDYEGSLRHFKKLAEIKPGEYTYNQYWAFSLQKLGRDAEAMEVYDKLIKIKDEDAGIRHMLGSMYYTQADSKEKAGDSTTAIALAKKSIVHMARAVELDDQIGSPADENLVNTHCGRLNLLALAQLKANNNQAALSAFAKLVELNPAYPNAYLYMGMTAYKENDFNKALDYYTEAAKYAADNMKTSIYMQIGRIYHQKRSQYPQAIEAYTNALKTVADAATKTSLYYWRGTAYHDSGNVLDYSVDENADINELIESGAMTDSRADQAVALYEKSAADLANVTSGNATLVKSAQQHLQRLSELQERLKKIKQQIAYFEKTK